MAVKSGERLVRKFREKPPSVFGPYVVIAEIKPKQTKGGIVLPDGSSETIVEIDHIVHDLGEYETDRFKVGDSIVFEAFNAEKMCARKEEEDKIVDYLIVKGDQVIGRYED